MYVGDVAEAFVQLLFSDVTGPVNLGTGIGVTVAEIVRTIGDRLGRPDLIRLGARPTPPNDPPVVVADATRLRDEVGFRTASTIEAGLARLLEYERIVALSQGE
jgi:nucleoside-diphosphate-sugar epimerase